MRKYRNALILTVIVLIMLAAAMLYKGATTEAIHIEINGGLAITANRMGKVINSFSFDEDGKRSIELADIDDENYTDAIASLLEKGLDVGFFREGDKVNISLWVEESSLNDRYSSVEEKLKEVVRKYSLIPVCESADRGFVNSAKEYGISVGKYRMICELQKLDPSISLDVYKDHSIKTLRGIYTQMKDGVSKTQAEEELGAQISGSDKLINDILFGSSKE